MGLTRIYVGAHFPLDVVGGAASGIIVGTVLNFFAYPKKATSGR